VIGDWAYSVAVSVWVFQEHGAAALGFFGVARYLTMAALGPLMSTAADRFPKRRVMVSADVARAVIVVCGAIAIAVDAPAVLVLGLGLLTSIISLAFRPAQAALLPGDSPAIPLMRRSSTTLRASAAGPSVERRNTPTVPRRMPNCRRSALFALGLPRDNRASARRGARPPLGRLDARSKPGDSQRVPASSVRDVTDLVTDGEWLGGPTSSVRIPS
jgi:hypothetical protein